MIPDIQIKDYNYTLSDERIAKYPLPERDSSKLLIYNNGSIEDSVFRNLPSFLPDNAIMVFNDTKVVPARLHFRRQSGAHIEIFCLQPVLPVEYNTAFASTESCQWQCVIGNSKRWKDDLLSYEIPQGAEGAHIAELQSMELTAALLCREGQTGTVEFRWKGGAAFSRVLELCGQVPIPPYLNRETEAIDLERYQTLYAHVRGSVAAPTAGLHFTEDVLQRIAAKGIDIENVCLHVGAGTFLPVKSESVSDHPMHREPFVVSLAFLKTLLSGHRTLVAVGTTSVRTLESLYYVGVSCIEKGCPADVGQWDPYTRDYPYSTEQALQAIVDWLEGGSRQELSVGTRIIIVPGFKFRLVDLLVTNFHQPESTLILLVSAFVGGDWRSIYDHALSHGYRFLSYGDSSLLHRR